jgi:hypothetical protein
MDIREETLRYLGYSGQALTDEENRRVSDAIAELMSLANPMSSHRVFPLTVLDGKLSVPAEIDLNYPDLYQLLEKSHSVLLIALGLELDRRLRYYAKTDASKLVIMDAAASALIEQYCDDLQEKLPFTGYTFRFSPGYGGVPLTMQKEIVRVLETEKRIGLTLTGSLLMIPQKSLTGIVGIGGEKKSRSCDGCRLFDQCEYRKRGAVCYKVSQIQTGANQNEDA